MKVTIRDTIEIRRGITGTSHVPGLVVVFDPIAGKRMPGVGVAIELHRPTGVIEVVINEVKKLGRSRSFFFAGLTKVDAPIGSVLAWADSAAKWRHPSHRLAST
jgi:hypothetical protein